MAIALRYAARSDVGLVRQNNQDSAYAGPHLLVVADGMGGHAGGDVASSLAIGELAPLDDESHGSDALQHLREGVMAAHRELLDRVQEEPQLTGMGTTVTALLRTGGRLALAHIGDSRAYLLRDGELIQITRDHTFVQTLVDEGRLTPDEAEQHPQRSVLMRVLSDVVDDVEPDLSMREARLGDRYLLCSDGLSGVVSYDTLRETLDSGADPAASCRTPGQAGPPQRRSGQRHLHRRRRGRRRQPHRDRPHGGRCRLAPPAAATARTRCGARLVRRAGGGAHHPARGVGPS